MALAERLRLAPTSLVVKVNGVEFPTVLTGAVAIKTMEGDLNVDGELTLTSQIDVIQKGIATILNSLFPYKMHHHAHWKLRNSGISK
jgi:hypothetical protein